MSSMRVGSRGPKRLMTATSLVMMPQILLYLKGMTSMVREWYLIMPCALLRG